MIESIKARLKESGISPHLSGYEYSAEAILMLCNRSKGYPLNDLYRDVAEICNSTGSRVERAIRTSISHSNTPEATNGEFLFSVADEFRKPLSAEKEKASQPDQDASVRFDSKYSKKLMQFLAEDNRKIDELIQEYPVSIPTSKAADFLGMDIASLRSVIENGVIGLAWRKNGKANHGYYIPTAQFVRWYMNLN